MRLDHVAVAVSSLDIALETFRAIWNLRPDSIETYESEAVREAMLPLGNTYLQLIEATTSASTVARFIERHGEGLHHIAIQVDDIAAEVARLRAVGARLIDETPRRGSPRLIVSFVHPKTNHSVLIEVMQRT